MPEKQDEKRSYKKTLNLPKTAFPMKANLVQNEPASQKRWDKAGLYAQLRADRKGKQRYVFHDGPPYANGSIHLGHLLNKVLKDFVVRSQTMFGKDVPYIPGWDCHGLPIEHKVMQELGDAAKEMEPIQIRRKCKSAAEKFVKLQKQQMQRLLTLADYDEPYLTMDPSYEAGVLEVFAAMVEKGIVYRALKPVHWSVDNQTALAEAELEYYDREDVSVYVNFDRVDGEGSLMIWTTTPWTLPANIAVAVHERFEYGEYDVDGKTVIVAVELAKKVLNTEAAPRKVFKGSELLGLEYKHPFVDRVGRVVAADYVTLEDGTGLVHTAPGHGGEDYLTAIKENLDVYCPVRADGTFDDTAPEWLQGKSIWVGNDLVVEHLRASGHLHRDHKFTHSYPHDWRGKTPVIFRATEQWFIGVDKLFQADIDPDALNKKSLRQRAIDLVLDHDWLSEDSGLNLAQAENDHEKEAESKYRDKVLRSKIRFIPEWGRNRMRGMLDSRPDWCLSRQRSWGLPIPWFHDRAGRVLLTAKSIRAVAEFFRSNGSDSWFVCEPQQILENYDPSDDKEAKDWVKNNPDFRSILQKGSDTFDVWFESGSSWNACMRARDIACADDAPAVTDLYLEGSDQHRGWFQHSLLPALAVTGKSAFATVLTHGFMVDKDGKKMSKSLGNTLDVEDLLRDFGADVCRWWVSSLNTDNDIKVDQSFFQVAGEEYRKVRNTIRFLLSNLDEGKQANYTFTDADSTSIDAWVLGELNRVIERVRSCYDGSRLHFRGAHEAIFNFCNETVSAVYGNAVKDRLYCDGPESPRRLRSQATIHLIVDALVRLVAPLLPHTADEAWRQLHGDDACVHSQVLPEPIEGKIDEAWSDVMTQRDAWLRAIENARQAKDIDNPLDVGVAVPRSDVLARFDAIDLADLCAVSRFELTDGDAITVTDLRDQPRCERSWKRDGTVSERSDGGMLSTRDAAALGLA